MRACKLTLTCLVLVLACLATLVSAIIDRAPPKKRRLSTASSSAREEHLSFAGLRRGHLQPPTRLVTTHLKSRPSFYDEQLFHRDGKPIYVRDNRKQRLLARDLQTAASDFHGFHVYSRPSSGLLTISRRPQDGTYLVSTGDSALRAHMAEIDQTTRQFGHPAARVAYGYKAHAMPPPAMNIGWSRFWKKKPKNTAPTWEMVHSSRPVEVSPGMRWQDLKDQLNDRRYLRFTSDGGASFGVRALPDGQIERQLLNMREGVPHFAP